MAALSNESHLGGSYAQACGRRCGAASIRCCDAAFRRGFNLSVSNVMISTSYGSQKVNIIRIIGTTSPLGCIQAPQIVPQRRKSPPLICGAGVFAVLPPTPTATPSPTLPTPPRHPAEKFLRKNETG